LADYQSRLAELEALHVPLIAASVDSQADAQALVEMLGLTFSVGYGLDFLEFARNTGAFYEVRRSIIHATAFILRRDGTVAQGVYATGPIGRLSVDDCIRNLG